MAVEISEAAVRGILTRASGFLHSVCSHSLQPYRGCAFGSALCGVGCYVRHNAWLTRGAPWGSFLEARTNAAEVYLEQHAREQRWARAHRRRFAIFLSSSTEPFPPQEERFGVTQRVLEAMLERPPDLLIVQTHTHRVVARKDLLAQLARRCELRIHLSIESDRDRLPGLPAPASSVEHRLAAAAELRRAGLRVVITVSPLLPIAQPGAFFGRIAESADAVVVDHFIEGDGTADGRRTLATDLPRAIERVDADALSLSYRDRMVEAARAVMPGRVGVSIAGFAGRFA